MPRPLTVAEPPTSIETIAGMSRTSLSAPPRRRWVLPALAFALVCAAVSYRIFTNLNVPGQPQLKLYGFMDFRDSFYYPVVALLDGHNPYLSAEYLARYPVLRVFSPYPPLVMLVHLPFALLPLVQAEVLYHLVSLALLVALAVLTLRLARIAVRAEHVLWLSVLLLLSHPAHMSLFLGQCTFFVVVGTYAALRFARTQPWLAALGFALTCFKPTFGIPLGVLLLLRRDRAAVIGGSVLAAAVSAPVAAYLAVLAGGLGPLYRTFLESYDLHLKATATAPASSFIRIDTPAFFGRLFPEMGSTAETIISVVILAIGALAVAHLARRGDETRRFSAALVCLTMLACMYHAAYDALLLSLPMVAVATDRWDGPRGGLGRLLRGTLLVLFAIPALNYAATSMVITWLDLKGTPWLVVNSLNGGALLLAFGIYVTLSLAYRPAGERAAGNA